MTTERLRLAVHQSASALEEWMGISFTHFCVGSGTLTVKVQRRGYGTVTEELRVGSEVFLPGRSPGSHIVVRVLSWSPGSDMAEFMVAVVPMPMPIDRAVATDDHLRVLSYLANAERSQVRTLQDTWGLTTLGDQRKFHLALTQLQKAGLIAGGRSRWHVDVNDSIYITQSGIEYLAHTFT